MSEYYVETTHENRDQILREAEQHVASIKIVNRWSDWTCNIKVESGPDEDAFVEFMEREHSSVNFNLI